MADLDNSFSNLKFFDFISDLLSYDLILNPKTIGKSIIDETGSY